MRPTDIPSPLQKGPFISVVITTYNRPDALAAVVEACFVQRDKNFEIIIADDGSTANTRRCIDALRTRSPVPLRLYNAGVLRKDGAFATEVFHLWHREWHRESERSRAGANRAIVLERAANKTILPTPGMTSRAARQQ